MPATHLRRPARHAALSPSRRLGLLLLEARDRLRVSDPGLGRLRAALTKDLQMSSNFRHCFMREY